VVAEPIGISRIRRHLVVLAAIAGPRRADRRDSVTRSSKHARLLAGALALVLALTLAAPPAFAAGPATAASPRPIAAAATAKVEAAPAALLAQAAPAGQAAPAAAEADTGDKPFFKTTKGAIALVLLAGTLGYMAYSMNDDRIKSPAK
jgi:hypothetical protein